MTRIETYQDELSTLTTRTSALLDQGKGDEARAAMPRIKELRAMIECEASVAETREALKLVPQSSTSVIGSSGWGEVRKAMLEKRAITAGAAGQNTVPGILKALVDGGHLISKVSTFYGSNSVTNVPVFAPTVAIPVATAVGATGTASDTTAVLAGTAMTLKPWYSTLPIANDALLSTSIEAELPGIFGKIFGAAMDKMIIAGASVAAGLGVFVADAAGVPVASDIAVAAAGTPKWVDLGKLALTVLGLGPSQSSVAIVMNPLIMAPLLAEATAGYDPMKVEYLTKGTILGVPVILSTYAPSATVAGSYVAVAGDFSAYALAIAQELKISPILTVGSDNVTFQSFMYMMGQPLVGTSFRRLKTV